MDAGTTLKELNEKIKAESAFVTKVRQEAAKVIVGQDVMIDRLLIGILTGGHILLEGVPGLAKTLTVSTLAKIMQANFSRIQFTPDLLPADVTGTMIYDQKSGGFYPRQGPIFANIVLADEINRAPAKVQSALLEAMQEKQVTLGTETHQLPVPFLVLATQNPIEQEGTYPLPEAQVDRFMLKLKVTYPNKQEERLILDRMMGGEVPAVESLVSLEDIQRARDVVKQVYVDEKIKNYIIDLIFATRSPELYDVPVREFVQYGASPRASIYLTQAAQAHAFVRGRGYVTPEDIKEVGMDILRHRVIITYEAEAEEKTPEDVIQTVFDHVEVP